MKKYRLRYAPSPTGMLHIGGARTALFNYLYAKNKGGQFIVRIDDTDTKRNVEGGEESQLNFLRWLGIKIDESVDTNSNFGPYRQSEKIELYREHLYKLVEKKQAYRCFHTEEEISKERDAQKDSGKWNFMHQCDHKNYDDKKVQELLDKKTPFSVRIVIPENKEITWDDMIRGTITVDTKEIGDWVAWRNNDMPTYNFTNVLDDHLMEISHIMRGEEHITNTPKQIILQEYFGFEIPTYAHLTLIVGEDRKKLSKRNETVIQFISQYEELGYLPEAVLNYLSLLGWSPKSEDEVFLADDLIKIFDEKGFSKSPAVFDPKKMEWYNNLYIQKLDDKKYFEFVERFIEESYKPKFDDATKLVIYNLYKEQLRMGSEISSLVKMFFEDVEVDKSIKDEDSITLAKAWIEVLKNSKEYTYDFLNATFKELKTITGLSPKKIFMPTRIILTSQSHGPDLKKTMEIMGKEKVISKFEEFLK